MESKKLFVLSYPLTIDGSCSCTSSCRGCYHPSSQAALLLAFTASLSKAAVVETKSKSSSICRQRLSQKL
eukprot:746828-Hanusia_phi.AAC.3